MPKRNELLPLSQNPKSKQLTFESTVGILTQFHHGRCIRQCFVSIPVGSPCCVAFCSSREITRGAGSCLGIFGKSGVAVQKQLPWHRALSRRPVHTSGKKKKKKSLYSTTGIIAMDQLVVTGKLVKSVLWFVPACLCCENRNVSDLPCCF